MLVTILGPNLPREAKATFEVHAAGCGHLTPIRASKHVHVRKGWGPCDSWTIEAASRLDVESAVYDWAPEENEDYTLGDYAHEFHFTGCAKSLPVKAEA